MHTCFDPRPQQPLRLTPKRPFARHQSGGSLVEFNLVAIPLLLMGLLILEAAYIHVTRQLAQVALLEAARVGATHQRQPDAIARAFTHAYLPRFAIAMQDARIHQTVTWNRLRERTGLSPWQIEILQPDDTEQLHLRLMYLHEPLTPITRGLLKAITPSSGNACIDRARQQGLWPIQLTLDIEMHSKPIPWQSQRHRQHDHPVIYGTNDCMH